LKTSTAIAQAAPRSAALLNEAVPRQNLVRSTSGAFVHANASQSRSGRTRAAVNPLAHFYGKPITLQDHQNSRWIAELLPLLGSRWETDDAVAIVVTSWVTR
jgi:acetyl-CoA acetyltransferase